MLLVGDTQTLLLRPGQRARSTPGGPRPHSFGATPGVRGQRFSVSELTTETARLQGIAAKMARRHSSS
ncbi:MAG: hypothetical protein ACRDNS_29275 [Trebonia sp.]